MVYIYTRCIWVLFICTFLLNTIASTDTVEKISLENYYSTSDLLPTKNSIQFMIFQYLNLSDQSMYSSLNTSKYNDFRSIFLLLLCSQKFANGFPDINILAKISMSLLDIPKHSNDNIKEYVAQIQKTQRILLPPLCFIQHLTHNGVSNWVMFHRDRRSNEQTSSFQSIADLTKEYGSFVYIYHVKNHSLYVSPTEQNTWYYDVEQQNYDKTWPWIFKAHVSIPLFIHYTIRNEDHYDFLGGYAHVRFDTKKMIFWEGKPTRVTEMHCYSSGNEPTEDCPKVIFDFQFIVEYQTSNTVVEHVTMKCVFRASDGIGFVSIQKNFWIKNGMLQLPVGHSFDYPDFSIKSIITEKAIISLEPESIRRKRLQKQSNDMNQLTESRFIKRKHLEKNSEEEDEQEYNWNE